MDRRDAAAGGALALAAAILLWPALFAGQALYYRDVGINLLPQIAFVFRSLAEGQLPAWNPLHGGGFAQWAGLQPPPFYPPQAVFLACAWGWMTWGAGLGVYLAFHHWLAGLAAYALGRAWGVSRAGALVAGLAYALGGYMVSLSNNFMMVPPAALLPLVVLLGERALLAPGPRRVALAGAAFALQISCGRPDTAWLTVLLLIGVCAWRLPAARQPWRGAAGLAAALGLGAAANAAMLLPAWEFVAHSNRAGGIPLAEAAGHSFPPLRAIALLMPDFFGSVEQGTDWGRYFINDPELAWATFFLTVYGGISVYLLALFARSPARRPGLAPFLVLVAAAACLLALGRWAPFHAWAARLPGAAYMRFPVKWLLLWAWALAMLAGLGVDGLRRSSGRWAAAVALLGTSLAALAALHAFSGPALARLAALDFSRWAVPPPPPGLDAMMHARLPALWPGWLGMAWGAWGWAAAALAACVLGARRPAAVALLPALVALDLLTHNAHFIFYIERDVYQSPPPLARFLAAAGGTPPARLAYPYGDAVRIRAAGSGGAEPTQPPAAEAYRHFIGRLAYLAGQLYGVPNISLFASLMPAHSPLALLNTLYPPDPATLALGRGDPRLDRYARVAGAAGVGFLAVPVAPPLGPPATLAASPNLAPAWQEDGRLYAYRNLRALPRARFAPDAEVVADEGAAALAMDRGADLLARRTVLVDDQALRATLALRGPSTRGAGPRACRIVSYANNRVVIENQAPESGFVVLADNHYPGWQVLVDGQPRPLLLADSFARAVWVEAGRHTVEFVYRPWSLAAGLAISLAALLALAVLGWGWNRRSARTRRSAAGGRQASRSWLGAAGVLAAYLALSGSPAAAIDLALQRACERVLGNRAGAVVALSPRDGRILALVNPDLALRRARPPGSVAKLATAYAAVLAGVADEQRTIACRPTRFGAETRACWRSPGHGPLALVQAIAQSCNIYFLTVGRELGAARLAAAFAAFGLGRATGVDLPGEASGFLPRPRRLPELLDMAFGEGDGFRVTPLQVAAMAAAIANGGTRYQPWLERRPATAPTRLAATPRARQVLAYLREGMRLAVARGSASRAAAPGLAVAGKTGTATFAPGKTHAWFAGYAPAEAPRVALVVYLERGTGFNDAAPLAGRILAEWARLSQTARKTGTAPTGTGASRG